ncbi:MAG: dNTP triphosphohydrolase [Planctomycetaceae bacterium]|nr:dNTP triphosphohydrolase [Planctomycetaceae bacterium]
MTPAPFNWRPFLSDQRIGGSASTASSTETLRSEFHRDYDRIIFSSAFRRLSDKTQVVPFPQSDYTRRRLTHSLEVSCVGRSLATEIYSHRDSGISSVVSQGDFEAIVATACLAHDIGNPPFGHFGERAIQDWATEFFSQNKLGWELAGQMTEGQRADLTAFEGNAQSFRVLTRLQMSNRVGGMRLTAATLGALIKYPRPSFIGNQPARYRKHGCFEDDRALFDAVFSVAGRTAGPSGEFSRHPLAWLTEAADDICYVVVDLEDGWKAGLVSLDDAVRILDAIGKPSWDASGLPDEDRLAMARALAISQLVQECSVVFQQHMAEILDGTFEGALIDYCPSGEPYNEARTLVCRQVFQSTRVLEMEAAGYRAIQGLLNMLVPAVLSSAPNRFQRHLIQLTGVRVAGEMSDYQKLLACTDNVSGMTDRYCVEQFQKLSGFGAI